METFQFVLGTGCHICDNAERYLIFVSVEHLRERESFIARTEARGSYITC
jgi:hypothetical protein